MDLSDAKAAIDRFLSIPVADPRLVPAAQEATKAIRQAAAASEDLRRYEETRKRMGTRRICRIAPPNFQYQISSV